MSDQFAFVQALPTTAFNIGAGKNTKQIKNYRAGNFVPHLRHGVPRISNSQNSQKLSHTEQMHNLSKKRTGLDSRGHQIQFDPNQSNDGYMSLRNSAATGGYVKVKDVMRNKLTNVMRSNEDVAMNFDSLDTLRISKGFNKYSRKSERYQSQSAEPRDILKLGKNLNLKKQNQRKQLLSRENNRLCKQEDRLFNERLKMVNAFSPAVTLPKVGTPGDSPRRNNKGNIF